MPCCCRRLRFGVSLEERLVDLVDRFRRQPKFELLEHFDQLLTVDQFYRGRTIANSLLTGSHGKRARGYDNTLVCSSSYCSLELPDVRWTHGFLVTLALKQHFKRNERIQFEDTMTV